MHLFLHLIIFFTCHLPDIDIFSWSHVSWYSEHIKKEMDSLWFWFLSCYEVLSRTFTSVALHAMNFEFHICKVEWQDILLIYCYATNYPKDNGLQEQICFSLLSLLKVWLTLVWLGNCTFVSLRTHPDGVFWECIDAFSLPMWVIFMTLLCGVGLRTLPWVPPYVAPSMIQQLAFSIVGAPVEKMKENERDQGHLLPVV